MDGQGFHYPHLVLHAAVVLVDLLQEAVPLPQPGQLLPRRPRPLVPLLQVQHCLSQRLQLAADAIMEVGVDVGDGLEGRHGCAATSWGAMPSPA